jgi:D-alanyl-D-alanine carboxypeptidase/D-alanyl-D-alanine-endopeptidase (penicillin-binding protein 4)
VGDLLADPDVAAGTWGVSVRSLTGSDTLVDVNAHRLLTPASALKVVTLAAAADQLGWDFTFDTRVVPVGAIANGTLDGDLVVIGSGDPSLDDWDGAASALFRSWADQLRASGISHVTGRVIGDDRVFPDDGFGAGWMWDDLHYAYSAPASGLQFNEGAAQIVVSPGPTVGAPAMLALAPPYATVPMSGHVRTSSTGSAAAITVRPLPRGVGVDVEGSIAIDASRQLRTVAVANPTLYFASALRAGLAANGVAVDGPAVDLDDVADAPVLTASMVPLLTHASAPLSTLADTLMKLSQNLYAESLLRTVGRARAGRGTAESGRASVSDVVHAWGVAPGELLMADGSGLSRYNLITPDAMVAVLGHVYADSRLREPYIASLPIAGRAGTLGARMKGTAAEGTVHAKTGSFTNARAVAGFVSTADAEPLAFSIIANNYGVPPDRVDRVTDAIIVALAEFRR